MKKHFIIISIFISILLTSASATSLPGPIGEGFLSATAQEEQTIPDTVYFSDYDKNNNRIHDRVEQFVVEDGCTPVIVSYARTLSANDITTLGSLGVIIDYKCKYIDAVVTEDVDSGQLHELIKLPGVTFIEPTPNLIPHLDVSAPAVKARESSEYSPDTAWELGYRGEGITIAILDTGVDDGHPDLDGKFIAGADFAGAAGRITTKNGRYNPDDETGHGTANAGIALGTGGADGRFMGVAPEAMLIDVRVTLGRGGDLMAAFDWCIDNKDTDWNNNGPDEYDGIDIISVSVGGADSSDGTDSVSLLVNRVVDAGIIVVTSIGNDGPNNQGIGNVAAAGKVICVGNLNDYNTIDRDDDEMHFSSSRGPRRTDGDSDPYDELKPDVAAPGTDITAPNFNLIGQNGRGYNSATGSSYSAPHVSGICALMLQANSDLSPEEVKTILQETAEPKGSPDLPELSDKYNYAYGYGIVDAFAAVAKATGYEPSNHRPEIKELTILPRFIVPGGDATVTTDASDPDNDELSYNYTATGGEFSGSGSEVTWTAPDELGDYEITAVVDDGKLLSEPIKVTVTVEENPTNHPPVIDNVEASPLVVGPGESSTITITASDPDGHEVFFEYTTTGGEIIGVGAQVTWIAPNTNGAYTISIVANDGELDSEIEKIVLTVEGGGVNKPPEIESISANLPSIPTGGTVKLSVTASDPENGELQYLYTVSEGIITGTGNTVTWTAPITPGGYIIEVTVTDDGELTDSDVLVIEVYQENFAPNILDARANPSSLTMDSNKEVMFTVRVNDENGLSDISKVTIDLSTLGGSENQRLYDNGKQGDKNREDGVYSYSHLVPTSISGGKKILLVRVLDRYNEGETAQISLNITASAVEPDSGLIDEILPVPGFEAGLAIFSLVCILTFTVLGRGRKRRLRYE